MREGRGGLALWARGRRRSPACLRNWKEAAGGAPIRPARRKASARAPLTVIPSAARPGADGSADRPEARAHGGAGGEGERAPRARRAARLPTHPQTRAPRRAARGGRIGARSLTKVHASRRIGASGGPPGCRLARRPAGLLRSLLRAASPPAPQEEELSRLREERAGEEAVSARGAPPSLRASSAFGAGLGQRRCGLRAPAGRSSRSRLASIKHAAPNQSPHPALRRAPPLTARTRARCRPRPTSCAARTSS